MLDISSRREGSATVVKVSGRIDAEAAPAFETACLERVRAGEKVVILDFGSVQYISSTGLRSLLLIGREQQERDGVLRLANLNDVVSQLFEQTRFNSLFTCFDSVEKAIAG